MGRIQEIVVKGQNSQKTVLIEVDVVVALVEAYMTKIPNEQRDTKMSLKVLRLHDSLARLLIDEVEAIEKIAERRTVKKLQEEV